MVAVPAAGSQADSDSGFDSDHLPAKVQGNSGDYSPAGDIQAKAVEAVVAIDQDK